MRLVTRHSSSAAKMAAQVATFVLSALWHGVYPGFYFSFVSLALLNIVSQFSTQLLRPLFVVYDAEGHEHPRPYWKAAYDAVTWFSTQTCFYYCANPFKQMSTQNVVATWNSVYWVMHVGGAALLVVFWAAGPLLRRWGSRRPAAKPKAQ